MSLSRKSSPEIMPCGVSAARPEPWREFHPMHDANDSDLEIVMQHCRDSLRPPTVSMIMDTPDSEREITLLKSLPSRHRFCFCLYLRKKTIYLIMVMALLLCTGLGVGLFCLWPRPVSVRLSSFDFYNMTRIRMQFEVTNPNYVNVELYSLGGQLNTIRGDSQAQISRLALSPQTFLSNTGPTVLSVTWPLDTDLSQQCSVTGTCEFSWSLWFDYAWFHWLGYRSEVSPQRVTVPCPAQ